MKFDWKEIKKIDNNSWIFLGIGFVLGMLWKMVFIIVGALAIVFLIMKFKEQRRKK